METCTYFQFLIFLFFSNIDILHIYITNFMKYSSVNIQVFLLVCVLVGGPICAVGDQYNIRTYATDDEDETQILQPQQVYTQEVPNQNQFQTPELSDETYDTENTQYTDDIDYLDDTQYTDDTEFVDDPYEETDNYEQVDNADDAQYQDDMTDDLDYADDPDDVQSQESQDGTQQQYLRDFGQTETTFKSPQQEVYEEIVSRSQIATNQAKLSSKRQQITLKYQDYLKKYKSYGLGRRVDQPPDPYRILVYQKNLNYINQFNMRRRSTYIMGLNKFTDLQQREFTEKYTIKNLYNRQLAVFQKMQKPKQPNIKVQQKQVLIFQTTTSTTSTSKIVDSIKSIIYTKPPRVSIDWRQFSGDANDQGACNSCYAFSALQSIQVTLKVMNHLGNSYFQNTGPFSVQQIISCGKEDDTINGCNGGGSVAQVYYYMKQISGIGLAQHYPYSSDAQYWGRDMECDRDITGSQYYQNSKFSLRNFRQVSIGNCRQIVTILRSQAVSVSISSNKLQFYSQGIYTTINGRDVSISDIDHQVTLVGFEHPNRYIIKNSWSNQWGINGHAYMGKQTGICLFGIQPYVL